MFRIIPLFLLPLILLSQAEMKCDTGTSGGNDKSSMKKESISLVNPQKTKATATHSQNQKTYETKATVKQLFNVTTVKVERRSSAYDQVNYGYIAAQDSRMVDVSTKYDGFVKNLYADTLYKRVTKGEALAKIYSPEVYQAKQDYLNSLKFNTKTSMPAMLKSAKIKLRLLDVSEEEIDLIRKEQKAGVYTTIHAPISGWIFEKNVNQGASFTSKQRLFLIINLDKVWMEAKLFQHELKKLDSLEHFIVQAKDTETNYIAEKSLLYPMLDPKEATATLRLSLDNDDQALKPGMYATLRASALPENRLVIPRTAAMRKNGIWYAFLATEFKGEYEPLQIKVQPLDNKNFEVISGLNENDIIVNNALFMMDSDAHINGVY